MKYLFGALFALVAVVASAQAPAGISYQAVIRNSEAAPIADSDVVVRIGILANSATGLLMWEEDHLVTTDAFGLFGLVIGQGTSTGGGNSTAFANINWGATNYFLRVQAETGNGLFDLLGTSQLLSVPYAFYANRTDLSDAQITNVTLTNQTLSINEGGEVWTVNLGPLVEGSTGQAINLFQLVGTELNIVEGAEAFVVDLSPLLAESGWTYNGSTIVAAPVPVAIGTNAPQSTLHVNGSISYTVQLVEGPINANIDQNNHVILANVTGGAVTLNLPVATTCTGRVYTVKRQGTLTNLVLILPSGGSSIEGAANLTLSGPTKEVVQIISDGQNWWVIARSSIN
ncbi:MAG: hypothetical protein ACFCUH_00465 [Flavobacteriales bacterium]